MKSCVLNEEEPQKFVAKIKYDHRICKVKKISLPAGTKASSQPSFDEAKASCKARKRKERQESLSSQDQDRKLIRSNSEERPVITEDKNTSIRRVSSSGDFPKSPFHEKSKSPSRKYEYSDKASKYDDHEYEKKRSHERFARTHNYRNKKFTVRRYKQKCTSKGRSKGDEKIVNSTTDQTDLPEAENITSPNYIVSPELDFASLIESSEPLLSRPAQQINETIPSRALIYSQRDSDIATHMIHLDPDVPKKFLQNPFDERIQKLSKQISSCKKKIGIREKEFEIKTGSKPTEFDRIKDEGLRKLYIELNKLKNEHRQLTEIVASGGGGLKVTAQKISPATLEETVKEIEKKLTAKRDSGNRNLCLEEMTAEQLIEEKIATQKALLFLESVHGRPQSKQDRDIVRPFYDRYRMLKRMVAKVSSAGTNSELATIHENEAMHFVTPNSSSNETESEKTETPIAVENDHLLENLHSLSKSELEKEFKITSDTKRSLKKKIKEFEMDERVHGVLTKSDKKPMEEFYIAYKKVKSRLKLLEALLAKC
ncbi:protein FAM13A [Anthonomus grandis grandis]|uniref:protein FAM13A n=1 Tax=Anthonomus grandis grandis TaxID=2921223 RepID=UPI00216563CB|nr:protein FAM13A [Anthonomus grandis grandis]